MKIVFFYIVKTTKIVLFYILKNNKKVKLDTRTTYTG